MDYVAHIAVVFMIYAILGISLNLLLGYSGLLSMAHAAFFGVGAYASALILLKLGIGFPIAMLVAVIASAILGAIVSIPALRIRDEYLVLLTLAFQMVVFGLTITLEGVTNGTTGLGNIPRPAFFGVTLVSPVSQLPLMLVVLLLSFLVTWRITTSPFGRVLKAMREDQEVVLSLGKDVFRFKVLAFIVAGGIAASAGSLFASYTTYIVPQYFSVDVSILIIAIVALGGTANLWGSVVGAFILTALPEILTFFGRGYDFVSAIRAASYGALLILFMMFRPQGIVPERASLRWGRTRTAASLSSEESEGILWGVQGKGDPPEASDNQKAPIQVKGLDKRFGGLKAVQNLTLTVPENNITALIGANGAGKTTVFNLITNFLKPDNGTIFYRGRDITNLPPHRIARLGVVRSFQGARVFKGMPVVDNVLLARPNQSGENLALLFFSPWRVAREEKENHRYAMACLGFVGLAQKAQELAGELSYAEQKMLQIACLLATQSEVLLLDEPVSGVDPIWIEHVLTLVHRLAGRGKVICIIEHNLDVVKDLADCSYFLSEGKIIAAGTPAELCSDPKLVEMYFGV